MNSLLVEMDHIVKCYGDIHALKNVSVRIPSGSIIGFIGADGSGKSTLMKIILTIERMDKGEGRVFGLDIKTAIRQIRPRIGYMPETFSLYQDLSVQENLNFFFRIYKLPARQWNQKMEWLYAFNRLKPFQNTLAGQLSGGMKQKLALSCALMNDPDLLVLDEPTTGVDPVSRNEFWKMLNSLKQEGKGIIISTPYLDEALQCDYIYLFHQGTVLHEGKPDELIQSYPGHFLAVHTQHAYQDLIKIKALLPETNVYLIGDVIHASVKSDNITNVKNVLKQFGKVGTINPTLEDIFLDLLREPEKENTQDEYRS
jgi:ABC-type multidrug transport system ATPase subunit